MALALREGLVKACVETGRKVEQTVIENFKAGVEGPLSDEKLAEVVKPLVDYVEKGVEQRIRQEIADVEAAMKDKLSQLEDEKKVLAVISTIESKVGISVNGKRKDTMTPSVAKRLKKILADSDIGLDLKPKEVGQDTVVEYAPEVNPAKIRSDSIHYYSAYSNYWEKYCGTLEITVDDSVADLIGGGIKEIAAYVRNNKTALNDPAAVADLITKAEGLFRLPYLKMDKVASTLQMLDLVLKKETITKHEFALVLHILHEIKDEECTAVLELTEACQAKARLPSVGMCNGINCINNVTEISAICLEPNCEEHLCVFCVARTGRCVSHDETNQEDAQGNDSEEREKKANPKESVDDSESKEQDSESESVCAVDGCVHMILDSSPVCGNGCKNRICKTCLIRGKTCSDHDQPQTEESQAPPKQVPFTTTCAGPKCSNLIGACPHICCVEGCKRGICTACYETEERCSEHEVLGECAVKWCNNTVLANSAYCQDGCKSRICKHHNDLEVVCEHHGDSDDSDSIDSDHEEWNCSVEGCSNVTRGRDICSPDCKYKVCIPCSKLGKTCGDHDQPSKTKIDQKEKFAYDSDDEENIEEREICFAIGCSARVFADSPRCPVYHVKCPSRLCKSCFKDGKRCASHPSINMCAAAGCDKNVYADSPVCRTKGCDRGLCKACFDDSRTCFDHVVIGTCAAYDCFADTFSSTKCCKVTGCTRRVCKQCSARGRPCYPHEQK